MNNIVFLAIATFALAVVSGKSLFQLPLQRTVFLENQWFRGTYLAVCKDKVISVKTDQPLLEENVKMRLDILCNNRGDDCFIALEDRCLISIADGKIGTSTESSECVSLTRSVVSTTTDGELVSAFLTSGGGEALCFQVEWPIKDATSAETGINPAFLPLGTEDKTPPQKCLFTEIQW